MSILPVAERFTFAICAKLNKATNWEQIMNEKPRNHNDETYQEDVVPVQSFVVLLFSQPGT